MFRLSLAAIILVMSVRISACFLNLSCHRTLFAKKSLLLSFSTMITSSSSTPNNSCTTTWHSSKSPVNHDSKPLEETSEAYKQLLEKPRTITRLKRVSSLLDYDQMVMMPQSDDTAKQRGLQQSALASIIHEKSTEPILKDLIEKSLQDLGEARETLDEAKRAHIDFDYHDRILTLAKKSYNKKILIPPALEAKRAELSSEAYSTWVKARQASDFALFSDCLDDCFKTAKELAAVLQTDQDKKSLYTQMLVEYEMGMDAQRIDEIFRRIEKALKPLIAEVLGSKNPPSRAALQGKFDVQKQKEMCAKIVTKMGFDCEHGRIDQSVHPFTMSLGPQDVRITSRFKDSEWYQGLAATIHEGGHAMYEQNLKGDDLEINEYLSMGMHESQSLFWERHVGLSENFCRYLAPILRDTFGDDFDYSAAEVYGAINAVKASPIRVEADELTYPLHVILRYNIERDVVEGHLSVKDIPARWNDDIRAMLGIDIESDSKGCLQDVHWSGLAIGYFPTYLIGSATAAQLAHYCEQDNPNMYEDIEKGEFGRIKAWLNEKVHRHGKKYESLDSLLKDQVGEILNPQYFIDYLTKKYKTLYKC